MSQSDDTDIMVDSSQFRTMRLFPNWSFIKEKLREMADGIMNSDEIIDTLVKFQKISYKNRFGTKKSCKQGQFEVLIKEYDEEIPQIFCKIATFVLRETAFEYPLFMKGSNLEHTFSKEEVLFLLCSMILQLIPKQQYHTQQKQRQFNYQLDFSLVFKHSEYKTKTIIEYIKRQIDNEQNYKEKLTIKRRSVGKDIKSLIHLNNQKKMGKITLKPDNDSIQNYYGHIKVDFANRFIGGGALSQGCVQQEIMFANHPELYISQLLCQAMDVNESIFFIGFKKYNKNLGYSHNTKFDGNQDIPYEYDNKSRAKEFIIAIDALCLSSQSMNQFKLQAVYRQILKAYSGFSIDQVMGQSIVSGNWGCGAFGGNTQLKLLIQWMSCTLANRQLIYCPFGSAQQLYNPELFERIQLMKIGEFWQFLNQSCAAVVRQVSKQKKKYEQIDLFSKMLQIIKQSQKAIVIE